jgi:hypothetical protein
MKHVLAMIAIGLVALAGAAAVHAAGHSRHHQPTGVHHPNVDDRPLPFPRFATAPVFLGPGRHRPVVRNMWPACQIEQAGCVRRR